MTPEEPVACTEQAHDVLTLCETWLAMDFPDHDSDLASPSAVTTSLTPGHPVEERR